MRILIGIAVVLVVFSSIASAGVIRHDRPDGIHTWLGDMSVFDPVGFVDGGSFAASGTLISPDIVLTAAHVVEGTSSLSFTVGGQTYTGDMSVAHSNWTGNLFDGYDIGLIHLSESVEDIEPARLYRGRRELHRTGIFAGYGMTGDGLTGATTFDGQKRVGFNKIDAYLAPPPGADMTVFLTDFDNPLDRSDNFIGSARPLPLEYLVAPGDSGGPVFLPSRFGLSVAGVHSFIAAIDGTLNADYGDISGHTRVSPLTGWINDMSNGFLTVNPGLLSAHSQFNILDVQTIPEPTTILLLGLGGLFLRRTGK